MVVYNLQQQYDTQSRRIERDVAKQRAKVQTAALKARKRLGKKAPPRPIDIGEPQVGGIVQIRRVSDARTEALEEISRIEQANLEALAQAEVSAKGQLDEARRKAEQETIEAGQEAIRGTAELQTEADIAMDEALKKLGEFYKADQTVDITGAIEAGIVDVDIYRDVGVDITQGEIDTIAKDISDFKAENIFIEPLDKWLDRKEYEGLTLSQQEEVTATGSYTIMIEQQGEVFNKQSETTGAKLLTGKEALALLKADTTKDVPQDAVLVNYDVNTGRLTFSSPSQQEYIVKTDKGDKSILSSEYDAMSDLEKLGFAYGRQATVDEFIALRTQEAGIEPSVFETMPASIAPVMFTVWSAL